MRALTEIVAMNLKIFNLKCISSCLSYLIGANKTKAKSTISDKNS